MRLEDIETPVSAISGIGSAIAHSLANLSINTVGDLLSHYPKDWDDRTKRVGLAEALRAGPEGARVHTIVQVIGHSWFGAWSFRSGHGGKGNLKIRVSDGVTEGELLAYNQAFLEKSLPVGAILAVTGLFVYDPYYKELQCKNFDKELILRCGGALAEYSGKPVPASEVLPVYPLTAGVSQTQMRKYVRRALSAYGHGIDGDVPPALLTRRGLLPKQTALISIHAPKTLEEAHLAKKSLIYEELYRFQVAVTQRAAARKGFARGEAETAGNGGQKGAVKGAFQDDLSPRQKILFASLPFELTEDQKQVIGEINADIDRGTRERNALLLIEGKVPETNPPPYTMARLLQGDVGSGKTLVAFFAALRVADWGGQSALLAPTELLARQHADNAGRLLGATGLRLAYLTGNVGSKERKPLLEAMAKGEVDLVIGTHALFSKQVRYKDLQLAIIDEQHRFGVLQRNAILEKGRTANFAPHLLMASATPIPRSLALTVFGDLDVSVIKTMPSGRLPVTTTRYPMGADMKNEQKVYDFVKKELDAGHQAYFVYPRIEDGEKSEVADVLSEKGTDLPDLKSAEQMFPILSQKLFPGHPCALVHSKVDEEEQHRILEDFRRGTVQVLVATSVVEVGVDNPKATCMVIEHAERFGLAALHQLRGRVGRGTLPSFCFLIFKRPLKETGQARLEALHDTTDGFAIAEEDLRLRGPGEMSGIQQSGYLTLGIADPIRDKELLEMARADALAQLEEQRKTA